MTGRLVPFEAGDGGAPRDPARFAKDLAARVNELLDDPATAARFGRAGRQRVLDEFRWESIAARTAALYASLG